MKKGCGKIDKEQYNYSAKKLSRKWNTIYDQQ